MELREVVYVYPDVAFAVSFLMNGLILWGTARVNKLTAGKARIIAGALSGAIYSFGAAFPQLLFLHGFWPKLIFSVCMFAITFAPLNLKRFVTSLVVFYIVSFSLGGFFVGVLYFFQSSPFYESLYDFSHLIAAYFIPALSLTVIMYVLVTRFAGTMLQKRLAQNVFRVPVRVLFADAEVEVEALIDTGNQLMDPLTQIPVIVVEYMVLKKILPKEVQRAFEQGQEPDLMVMLDSLAETTWSTRFRVIPFTSLGKQNGMLIGFRPDLIEVNTGGSLISTRDAIVGVYNQELSPEGGYRALLNPDMLDEMTA